MGISLLLNTESYPFDGASERTFIKDELPFLVRNFDRVVIVPSSLKGIRLSVAGDVEVDETYAKELNDLGRIRVASYALISGLLAGDLSKGVVRSPKALKSLVHFCGKAEHARRWANKFLKRKEHSGTRWLFYTYWWTATTTGFGMAKGSTSNLKVISRCHNVDLFEERHFCNYLPCRKRSLETLDALFPDSDRGLHYLRNRYDVYPRVLETARLGVNDPISRSSHSKDGVFRVVSCSFLNPVKRVDLLAEGLLEAGLKRPDQKIEWVHFGFGQLKDKVLDIISKMPQNVFGKLVGYTPDLMKYYGENPVDVFVNVSEYEGTPVSIMEAIACGIPIIATAVGGNLEIATDDNGTIIPADSSSNDIATALLEFFDKHYGNMNLRNGSRRIWKDRYNADKSFQSFSSLILSLADNRSR